MWAGTLAFGPVNIPVRLGPATRPRELAFRQVHAADGGRITLRRSCTVCGADVPYADVAKAYQRPDGDLVPVTDEELASLPLEASRRIELHVGRDLQFIRINGTVVGSLAGLVIYSVAQLLF